MVDDNYDILDKLDLKNPDIDKSHVYEWDDYFLQSILGSLIYDGFFFLQCNGLIKPEYFREKVHSFICKSIFDYYTEYNCRPNKTILRNILEERFANNSKKFYYLAELEAICDAYEPGIYHREFFLNKITEFAKTQALRTAYSKTLDIFKTSDKDKWPKIRDILTQALQVDRNVDLGLDYLETIEERYKRMQEKKDNLDFFPTGFPTIDGHIDGGICRGEIAAFAGMSNSGKSLALVKVAKANLMMGRNVLYISLEMNEDKVAERFDSMLTNVPIKVLYDKHNASNVKAILHESRDDWGKIIIKQFGAGIADVNTCWAFINQLHINGIRPDVAIVDYVGEMKDAPHIKTYESRQRLVRDLRGLAVAEDIAIFTAMQINRGGRDAMKEHGYLDDDSLADSAGQVRPLDALWTISQTEPEQKANCGTIFVSKHRSGKSRFYIRFRRDPETLEMHEITSQMYQQELSKVVDKTVEEIKMEDFAKDSWTPGRG